MIKVPLPQMCANLPTQHASSGTDVSTRRHGVLGRSTLGPVDKTLFKHITSLCSAPYVGWQRDTARICCWTLWCSAPGGRSYRSISAARRAHSSKPASTAVVDRRDRQTDGHSTVIYRPCHIGLLCQQCQKSKPCATSVAPRTTIYHCSQ